MTRAEARQTDPLKLRRQATAIPDFLKEHQPLARLFERNYLQSVGCHVFRTEFARQINFDSNLHGAENLDFALRAVVAGAKFRLMDEPGYRVYAYQSIQPVTPMASA